MATVQQFSLHHYTLLRDDQSAAPVQHTGNALYATVLCCVRVADYSQMAHFLSFYCVTPDSRVAFPIHLEKLGSLSNKSDRLQVQVPTHGKHPRRPVKPRQFIVKPKLPC